MKRLGCGLATAVLIIGGLLPVPAYAASQCNVTITPTQADAGSSETFNVSVSNSGPGNFRWVDVTMPSSNFSYSGNSVSGWFSTDHEGGTTFFGGTIGAGSSANFSISGDIGADIGTFTWAIQASTSMSGTSPIACEGSLDTTVGNPPPNDTTNNISNVTVTNITSSGATILWASDLPASSVVYYGLTSDYGESSSYNSSMSTLHQAILTNLSPSTTYHFQAAGLDGNSEFVYSADGTFTTLAAPPSTGGGGGGSGGAQTPTSPSVPTSIVNPLAKNDRIPPTLIVDTKLSGTYKVAPVITGSAGDNEALASIDYSFDGGKNWLPTTASGLGTKKATYKVELPTLKDGNYEFVVRVQDKEGNSVLSAVQTLVIDLLPPLVGGSVLSVGPQLIFPDENNSVTLLQSTDQKITLNATGGPIAITLEAKPTDKAKTSNLFSLSKSPDSGLWSGTMSFKKAGNYTISVLALDGAGNKTTRTLYDIQILPKASVYRRGSDQPVNATTALYFRSPETQDWTLWDAGSYSQKNPQLTSTNDGYGFFVPAGTYYIRYEAAGYQTIASRSITLDHPGTIAQDMHLSRRPGIYTSKFSFSIPWVSLGQSPYKQNVVDKKQDKKDAVPSIPSSLKLPLTTNQSFAYTDLLSKPTVLSFVNSWAPSSQDQLSILNQVSSKDVQFYSVMAGQSISEATVYNAIGGYTKPTVVDATNQLAQTLKLSITPTHYFIDRHGVVKKVMVGVLSKEELFNNVQN